MPRWVVLAALVATGCEPSAPPAAEPIAWAYAPPPAVWQVGADRGRFGRGVAPTVMTGAGIAAAPGARAAPLRLAAAWPVPGDGAARAIVYGADGAHTAVELIDVDAGRVVWRDRSACAGPVVGVTAEAVVCADATGIRGIGLDGKPRWESYSPFLALTEERVAVLAGPGEVAILDAARGDELARVKLPPGVEPDAVLATCGDVGRELFAVTRDGKLARVAEGKGGPAVTWAAALPGGFAPVVAIDACEGDAVIVTGGAGADGAGASSVLAFARANGHLGGRVDGVRGMWPARGDAARVELATASGVASWPRDLAGEPRTLALPPLGELLGSRGDRRLVRATAGTAVLLDAGGVRAYVALAQEGAVLGDRALIAMSWRGSAAETVRRALLPAAARRGSRIPRAAVPVAVPAELRDLPPSAPVDAAGAIGSGAADDATGTDGALVLAADGATAYAAAGTALARVDLSAKRARWQRADACPAAEERALAATPDALLCASLGARGIVVATTPAGAPAWAYPRTASAPDAALPLDALAASGDTVALFAADRLLALDAATGRARGELASDDGGPVRAALVTTNGTTYLLAAERGRLVARIPSAGMLAAWSLAADGAIRAIHPATDAVLVELEDGDAYRIDLRTAAATAVPGLGLGWHALGDLVAGEAPGGPLYAPMPAAAPPPRPLRLPLGPARALPPNLEDLGAPMSTPIPTPPPVGAAWQLALYAPAFVARNDYALTAPRLGARGPAASPIAVVDAARDVLVLDARTGDPLRRAHLPDDALPRTTFATVVDGAPVAGAVLHSPLRVVLF